MRYGGGKATHNVTILNALIYYWTCTWISCDCTAITELQARAAQLRLTSVNVGLNLSVNQQRFICALKGKHLWSTFISHDGCLVTHRGFKNGNLLAVSPLTYISWAGIRGTAPRTAPRRWPIPTPAHLEQRAHCVTFPLLSSSSAFHVLPSFSPPVLHSAPSAVAFPQRRYLAVLVRPPLQPSPSSRFGFSNSGNEMFHYLHFTAFNRERI